LRLRSYERSEPVFIGIAIIVIVVLAVIFMRRR
jgi:uncharacterized membrane protein